MVLRNSAGEQERGRVEGTWPLSHLPPLPLHAVQAAVGAEDVVEDIGVNEHSPSVRWRGEEMRRGRA